MKINKSHWVTPAQRIDFKKCHIYVKLEWDGNLNTYSRLRCVCESVVRVQRRFLSIKERVWHRWVFVLVSSPISHFLTLTQPHQSVGQLVSIAAPSRILTHLHWYHRMAMHRFSMPFGKFKHQENLIIILLVVYIDSVCHWIEITSINAQRYLFEDKTNRKRE